MNKILAVIVLALGASSLAGSKYIESQVLEGQQQIKSAQKKVDSLGSAFSMSPYTEYLGKSVTGSAQDQIDEGQQKVDKYSKIAQELHIAGYTLLVLGALGLVISLIKRKRK